jgi:glucosamine--fructose-6-phosphate aminotransferase (isomerizing)
MCGIVGILYQTGMVPELLKALKRLEYRGYDSSGIALFDQGQLVRWRALGPLAHLAQEVPIIHAVTGIGHTRWATHGEPSVRNAHPHFSNHRVAVVHNGIIENFSILKDGLQKQGYVFASDTDTEVIAHLIDALCADGTNPEAAFVSAINKLEGNFSIACMISGLPEHIFVARRGTPPLLLGKGPLGFSIGSDALGLVDIANEIAYLESDTYAVVGNQGARVYTWSGQPITVQWIPQPLQGERCDQGTYAHFMRKEIDEQPDVIERLLGSGTRSLDQLEPKNKGGHVSFLGCGTSFYAAWVGKYILEHEYGVALELASEFSYRLPKMIPGVTLALSQSGETADTLKAVAYARSQGQKIISVVNAPHSSLARYSDYVLDMQAGPEIGVASTKAFTAQLWLLFALGGVSPQRAAMVPDAMRKTLTLAPEIDRWAVSLVHATGILYMGRGSSYPIALEGALKMKELSYIHAEGLAAGELKHGSLALVDEIMPILFLAPLDDVFEKSLGNIHEIIARKGRLYVITDAQGAQRLPKEGIANVMILPDAPEPLFNPFLQVIVLQLLAYYTALHRGCSIDKPRNLAKSVTVE